MPKFRIAGTYRVDFQVDVEAEDRETAIDIVESEGFPGIERGVGDNEDIDVDSCDELRDSPAPRAKKKAS